MSRFKDYFSGHADAYAAARPSYPDALFDWLAGLTDRHDQVWDAGCGNGQASRALARHYDQVLATDASADQIANAAPADRVTFQAGPAESCPLSADSCDLVTVAQAAHWFERSQFYAEARRVLRPGGVLALWCYGLNTISPATDAVVRRLYDDILGADWPPERRLIDDGYRTLAFPFAEIPAPDLVMALDWTVDQHLAYLRSWSAAQRYLKRTGEDPVQLVEDELRQAWGDERRRVMWPLHFRVGRSE